MGSHIFEIFEFIPFAVLPPLSSSLIYEHILDFQPMNCVIAILGASSLNLPITFLIVL